MKQTDGISSSSLHILARLWPAPACARTLARVFPLIASVAAAGADRPTVEVTVPNTLITQSCLVVIPPGTVIRDVNDQGVSVVGSPNIEIV